MLECVQVSVMPIISGLHSVSKAAISVSLFERLQQLVSKNFMPVLPVVLGEFISLLAPSFLEGISLPTFVAILSDELGAAPRFLESDASWYES